MKFLWKNIENWGSWKSQFFFLIILKNRENSRIRIPDPISMQQWILKFDFDFQVRDSQITSLPHKNSSRRRDVTVAWNEPLAASFLGENVPKEHTSNVLLAYFHPETRLPKLHSRPPWHPAFLNCFYGVVMWFANLSPKNVNPISMQN